MGASIGTAKSNKSLPEAMQRLFTELTRNQARKKQFYRRQGFKIAIVTVAGFDIAFGTKGDDYGVFKYDQQTQKIGRCMSVISLNSTKACVWTPVDTPLCESTEELSYYYLTMAALFNALTKIKSTK